MKSASKLRVWLPVALIVGVCAGLWWHGPVVQSQSYHQFADQREWLGLSHFWNKVSNLPFLLPGIWGLWLLARGYNVGVYRAQRLAYGIFFASLIAVTAGSWYYHSDPSDVTLLWDRLPITVAFMAFFAAFVGERIAPAWTARLLVPLILLGIGTLWWWRISGDLRPYLLVQILPIVLVPTLLVLYPTGRGAASGNGYVWGLLGAYLLAKGLEFLDEPLQNWIGFSGHPLKHIAAALGACCIAWMVARRPPIGRQ